MNDADCVRFLQEVLPRLGLRWPGFRKVRRQVCRRLQRRLTELQLPQLDAYLSYLAGHRSEWQRLDELCRISISRFYRDRRIFEVLAAEVLPEAARLAHLTGAGRLRIWSAGCASGEEPYTLALLWHFRSQAASPSLPLRITATDIDQTLLARARSASYPASSLRELPPEWVSAAFTRCADQYCLRPEVLPEMEFLGQDLRTEAPAGPFHLVTCRNLAFTYFQGPLQREVLFRIAQALAPGGFLVIGISESLPRGDTPFAPFRGRRAIYQKVSPGEGTDTS